MSPTPARIGQAAAITAALASIGYGVVQIGQIAGLLRFPADEIAIFGFSICIPIPYLLAMLALHHLTPEPRRFFSHAGVALAGVYATICSFVYIIELCVSVPLRLHAGSPADPRMLNMSQPQFMFSVDSLGYIFMSLSALLAAFAFEPAGGQLRLRRAFVAHGLNAPVIILIMVFPALLPVGSLWLVTAPLALLMLAGYFRAIPA
jgi:hypothetical protein